MRKIVFQITIILLFSTLYLTLVGQEFDGYALYSSDNSSFLIDKNGSIAHRWNCNSRNNYACFLKENGNLVRGGVNNGNILNGPAVGGKVEEYTPDGQLVWEFVYSDATKVAHHDICEMPNGGVLLTAWEVPPLDELQALGYEGTTGKYPTHFIEVQQDGSGGKIVWEWHMKDHFVQDVDSTLQNYGIISEHPELMDINVQTNARGGGPGGPGGRDGDWFHVNGVHYDAEFDQIVFSSRYLSEIFIIDHSTTSVEAAGHTGGNSGKGGDLLWRWGNPSNYGTTGDKLIGAAVHDARVIPNDGRINGGFVQIFNNEGTDGNSQIDAIELPRVGYNFIKEANLPYGPDQPSWTHKCRNNADGQSAADKLPNGNTYVNLSRQYMYEVDKDDNLIWQYSEGPSKGFRYTCNHPGIQQMIAEGYLDGTTCMISATNEAVRNPLTVSPNPSEGVFYLSDFVSGIEIENFQLTDIQGHLIANYENDVRSIDLSEYDPALYLLKINLEEGHSVTKILVRL